MKKKIVIILSVVAISLFVSGCGGGGGSTIAVKSCEYVQGDFQSFTSCGSEQSSVNIANITSMSEKSTGDAYDFVSNGINYSYSPGTNSGKVIADLLTAHVNGNDGTGVNYLIVDGFSNGVTHGDSVKLMATKASPGATFITHDIADSNGDPDVGLLFTASGILKVDAAEVINLSFGSTNPVITPSIFEARVNTNVGILNSSFSSDAFTTVSAGNDSGSCANPTSCNLFALYLTSPGGVVDGLDLGAESEFRDRTIVVGALDDDGQSLTNYSTKAGMLKDHYIAAPLVASVGVLLSQNDIHGNLTGVGIKTRILTSADDLGDLGVDSIFGHGSLNVGRTLAPVGGLH